METFIKHLESHLNEKNINKVLSLKYIAKKEIISLILEKKIKITDLKNKLDVELFNYINDEYAELRIPSLEPFEIIELHGHNSAIKWIYCDEYNRNFYITASKDKTARIWNIGTKECIAFFSHDEEVYISYMDSDICIAITITVGNFMYVWDIKDNRLLNKVLLNNKINRIEKLDDRYVLLISKFYANIYDFRNSDIVSLIDRIAMNLMVQSFGKYICKIENNSINITNVSTSMLYQLSGHEGKINNIEYVKDDSIISCSEDDTIRYWNIIENKCYIINRIKNPLIVRQFDGNNFIVLSRNGETFYYDLLNVNTKEIYRLLCLTVPNSGDCDIVDIEMGISKKSIVIINSLVLNNSNDTIWVVIHLFPGNDRANRRSNVYITREKPIKISNNNIVIKNDNNNGSFVALDLVKNETLDLSVSDKKITFYEKYVDTDFFIIGFEDGMCVLCKIQMYITLEQYLLLLKIEKYNSKNMILKYNKYYEEILSSNKYLFIYFIITFYKILVEILEKTGLEEKAIEMFNKKISELNVMEICKLCDYEYQSSCK